MTVKFFGVAPPPLLQPERSGVEEAVLFGFGK